jgi:hypothetical protein
MAYFFPAPVSDQIAYFRRSLEGLRAGGTWAGAYLHDTILALLAVESAAARDHAPLDVVTGFRTEAAAALAPLAAQIRSYVELVADEAETAGDDAWAELCGKRSAIELLRTLYADTPAVADLEPADVARLDDEMRRVGQEQGPLEAAWRVPGMPASHWWWWYPGSPPPMLATIDKALRMTDERLARIPAGSSVHNMFGSIRAQLEFMRDTVAAGRSPTTDEKNRLTLGVIGVREFENDDPDYSAALADAAYEFKKL